MVLVAVEPHISSPGKAGGVSRRLINKSDQLFMISQKVARSSDPSLSLQSTSGYTQRRMSQGFLFESGPKCFNSLASRTSL